MAKILKIKIKRTQTAGGTHYDYPPEYDSQKIQVLTYETSNPDNIQAVVDRGNKDEYLIGIVKDADAPQFLASADVEEIDYNTALNLGNRWTKRVLKITDLEGVARICQKIADKANVNKKVSAVLIAGELDVLDADNPEPGIMKSKSFQERLDRTLAVL